MSRVVVIGASRGIGFETVKVLLSAGHEVVAFSRDAENLDLNNFVGFEPAGRSRMN